ncbi:hypothetical protein [Bryobacter aggregatus]|uniref:hypothetical protein n=1 Tax=Bryobacter aggregatus TaxID=360054 RepID=UPI0012BA7566|nr:hypothetical protein [Bryobacter aggregatus]
MVRYIATVATILFSLSSHFSFAEIKPASQIPSITPDYTRYHLFLRNLASLSRRVQATASSAKSAELVSAMVTDKLALNPSDTQSLLIIAKDLDSQLQILDGRATAIIAKIRTEHKKGDLYPPPPKELTELQMTHISLVNESINKIKNTLSATSSTAIDSYLRKNSSSPDNKTGN